MQVDRGGGGILVLRWHSDPAGPSVPLAATAVGVGGGSGVRGPVHFRAHLDAAASFVAASASLLCVDGGGAAGDDLAAAVGDRSDAEVGHGGGQDELPQAQEEHQSTKVTAQASADCRHKKRHEKGLLSAAQPYVGKGEGIPIG